MSGTLLRRTALLLTVIAMLSGCEEVAAPKPVAKPPPAERPAQLYTEIGAAELLERWTVLPGGAVAEAVANPSGRRLAAATDGFSGLSKTFRFSNAREYGACVVFTVMVDEQQEGGVYTHTAHIIDCPGAAAAGNSVDGLFHAAHICEAKSGGYYAIHILRAGSFEPATQVHPHPDWDELVVEASIADHTELFLWMKHITPGGAQAPIMVNWAAYASGYRPDEKVNMAGFDTLHQDEKDLRFAVDKSSGVVKVGSNDGAAFTEYQRRCESLGSESAIRPTPS